MTTTALLRVLNTNLARCTFDKKGAAPTVNYLSAKTGKVNWYVVLLAICVLKCYLSAISYTSWTGRNRLRAHHTYCMSPLIPGLELEGQCSRFPYSETSMDVFRTCPSLDLLGLELGKPFLKRDRYLLGEVSTYIMGSSADLEVGNSMVSICKP